MLLSFDLLILILSWISSPVWGSRKQMTRNSGEVPKKVPTHCLRRRDISCLLPSLQQSLWIAHLLEDMGSIFSQGSSHTIFTPLRGTILPCWCCRVSPASVFGCPQGTPCPLIGVMLLGTAVSPSHHLQQPFTLVAPHSRLATTVMPPCSLPELGQMSPRLVSFVGRCGYSQSRRELNQQHIWPMDSRVPPSFPDLPEGLGQPHPCRSCLTLSGCVPRCGSETSPAAHRQTALPGTREVPQFAAAWPWPLLAAELMLWTPQLLNLHRSRW